MKTFLYKPLIPVLLLVCAASVTALAQWTTSGANIYNSNTGNVGVGTSTTAPTARLEVAGDGTNGTPMILRNNTSTVLAAYASNANATALASFQAYRSRGTYAAPANVVAGDRIGGFYGQPYISSAYRGSTAIEMYVGASPGTNSYPAYMVFGTTPTNGTTRLERMRITEGGNVGIGTASPGAKFEVFGIHRITSGSGGYLQLGALNTSTDNFGYISSAGQTNGSGLKFETTAGSGASSGVTRMMITSDGSVGINTTPNSAYRLDVNGPINATSLFVNGQPFTGSSQWTTSGVNAYFGLTGNVGIGSTNPDAKLTVNGTVHAKEVRVDLSVPGPDYVFDKDYKLLSLDQVRAYIEKHHHLPDVPSAAEMEKNGVNVSEMNMILLRKVEELTLHLLDASQRIERLEAELQKGKKN